MADEVPIIIGSDDEESDSDDVVLIKEEIEVDDGDDVIFLSETKATPPPPPEHHVKPHPPDLPLRSLSLPAGGGGSDPGITAQDTADRVSVLNRSISISSCAGRLSLDDADSRDQSLAQCDTTTLPLLSNIVNANSGPLDLSSKSSDTNIIQPPAMCGGCNANAAANITGSGGMTQNSAAVDPASLSLSAVWQTLDGSVTIDTRNRNFTNPVGDTGKSSQCAGASFQTCSVSGSRDAGFTSNSQAVAGDARIHAPMLSMGENRVHAPVLSMGENRVNAPVLSVGSFTDVSGLTSNSLSVSVGSYSDLTVLPGGFMANTAMLPQFPDATANTTVPVCDARITDLNTATYYSFPMSNGSTLFTNTQVQEKTNSIVPVSASSFSAKPPVSCGEPMDTSDQKLTVTKPTLCTDKQSENRASSSGLDNASLTVSAPVVVSTASQDSTSTSVPASVAVSTTSMESTSATVSAPVVVSASGDATVSVALSTPSGSTDSTPRSDSAIQPPTTTPTTNTITSLSSDVSPCASASTSLSVPTSSSSVLQAPIVSSSQSAPEAAATSTAPPSSSASCATTSSSPASSACDAAMPSSHVLTTSRPSTWQITTATWSDRKSPSQSTAVITSPTASLPASTCTDSPVSQSVIGVTGIQGIADQAASGVTGIQGTAAQSVSGMTGLPGGSTSFLPVQQPSAPSTTSTPAAITPQTQTYTSTSSNTFNLSDSSRLYNPLTLPIYMQNQQLKHSLSLSALSNRQHSSMPMYKRQSSFPRTTPLPPKKQKRNYSDGVSKCANCAVTLIGEKFSRCPNGHTACAKCLEEKVKLLLTGKARESVRCLDRLCDSFYPVSELKLSLPSMVVEILEDKLDQEYVDYISDMILKNASGDTDQPGSSRDPDRSGEGGSTEKERFQEFKCEGIYPNNWSSMDENVIQKKGYVLVPLEVDTPEYEEVVLQFFQSMIDQNVEVTSVHRVQNPIQWKYYCVKKCEIEQDNEGFALERQLFHGTSSTVVDAICRRGFDWRVCGKHGTLYGQGSYFAVNASYSHQYTDLKTPRHLGSSMMLANPMSMTLPTTPSLIYPPVNINFGQPLNTLTFTALNLSHTATPPTTNTSTGSAFQAVPSPSVVQGTSSGSVGVAGPSSQTGLGQLLGQQTGLPPVPGGVTPVQGASSSGASSQRPPMGMRFKVVPKQPTIRTLVGHPSSGLMSSVDGQETIRTSAKVFLGRVLVGKFVKGHAKLRKPPPLYPRQDPFGKCFDSCVDEPRNPKIFVIFDSAQAYPEYLLEYTFTTTEKEATSYVNHFHS